MLTKEKMCQEIATLFGLEDPMTIKFCRMAEKLDNVNDLRLMYVMLLVKGS